MALARRSPAHQDELNTPGLDTRTLRGMGRALPWGERRRAPGALLSCLVRWFALQASGGLSLTRRAQSAYGRHHEKGAHACFFTPLCCS